MVSQRLSSPPGLFLTDFTGRCLLGSSCASKVSPLVRTSQATLLSKQMNKQKTPILFLHITGRQGERIDPQQILGMLEPYKRTVLP